MPRAAACDLYDRTLLVKRFANQLPRVFIRTQRVMHLSGTDEHALHALPRQRSCGPKVFHWLNLFLSIQSATGWWDIDFTARPSIVGIVRITRVYYQRYFKELSNGLVFLVISIVIEQFCTIEFPNGQWQYVPDKCMNKSKLKVNPSRRTLADKI